MRIIYKEFQGVVTSFAEEDTPPRTFRDLRNVDVEDGELVGRLGASKINTERFGFSGGGLLAQFVPQQDVTA